MSAPQHLLISEEALESVSSNGSREIPYTVVDEGDLAVIDVAGDRAAAVLINDDGPEPSDLAPADAELLLKVTRTAATDRLAAYRLEGGWHPIDVTVVPRVPDVFDRIRGCSNRTSCATNPYSSSGSAPGAASCAESSSGPGWAGSR